MRQRWFILGLLLLLLVVSVLYTIKVLENRSAIVRFLSQLQDFDSAETIYDRDNYPHPPLMGLALSQLARLPILAAALVWFYLKVGMTFLAVIWSFRLIEEPGKPFPPWAKGLTILLSLRPILGDLSHGNVNLMVLFLVVACLYAYHQERDLTAGIVLGLAIVCRLTPALLVPYFIWKREWKTLLGCVFGLALFVLALPALFLGWEQNWKDLTSWAHHWILPYVVQGLVMSDHANQSLSGLVVRLGTHSPSSTIWAGNTVAALIYHNLWSLDLNTVRWIVKGCLGVFAVLCVWTCRTPTTPRTNWRLAAEFSTIALGMLLFSERTWKHHCVLLLLPFAVLAYYLATCRPSPRLRFYLIATLVGVVLLMASTSTGLLPEALFGDLAKWAQVYGAYVWANLLLVTAMFVLLRQDNLHADTARRSWSGATCETARPARSLMMRMFFEVVGQYLGLGIGLLDLVQGIAEGEKGWIAAAVPDRPIQLAKIGQARPHGGVELRHQIAGTLLDVGQQLPQCHATTARLELHGSLRVARSIHLAAGLARRAATV